MKIFKTQDQLVRNISWISLLVFIVVLQLLIIVVYIYHFIPIKLDPILNGVPEGMLKTFMPERESTFYRFYILMAMILQAVAIYVWRNRLNDRTLEKQIRPWVFWETVWVTWQLFAIFKITQYQSPVWANDLLYAGFACALLAKIFWPEFNRGVQLFRSRFQAQQFGPWAYGADALMVLSIILSIGIWDPDKAVVRDALYDSFNQFDQWLMAPVWAYHKGLTSAVDVVNPLNWGVPVLVNALSHFFGGVNYPHVISVLCFLGIAYYIAFYYLLRYWLKSTLLAAAGVWIAIKLQMFNTGVSPLIWIFPDQTILRHFFDLLFFYFLIRYARGGQKTFLLLSAASVGLSMAYVFDTGFYLLMAFYAYVAIGLSFAEFRRELCPSLQQWRNVLILVLLPWIVMMAALFLWYGPAVLHGEFWSNSFQNVGLWLKGLDALPVFVCLKQRNFFAFFAAFAIGAIYTFSLMIAWTMVYTRRWGMEKLLIIPVSVYGLGSFAHFLWHSSIDLYYMIPLPLVVLVLYGFSGLLSTVSEGRAWIFKFAFMVLSGVALASNLLFTYYPHAWDMVSQQWVQEKVFYQNNFNLNSDVDLIRQQTAPTERVAIISSFEVSLLMQADRAPFFYHFPLIQSQMMPQQSYAGFAFSTKADIIKLSTQLERQKPKTIFVEKKLFSVTGSPSLTALSDYLKAHYHTTGHEGIYLIMLQKNNE